MIEAFILGIVQGLTEFLPVSSTAHLILFPWFFHWGGVLDSLTFDIALHAGTLLALVICFWKDWVDLILRRQKLFMLIVLASVPAGIAGVLLNDYVEHTFRSPYIIVVSLVVFGIVMLMAERTQKTKTVDRLTLGDAITIGFAQAVALIPGVSRSGITISAGLFRGLEREASARFSFLLSTPVIAGAVLLHAIKLVKGQNGHDMNLFVIGFISSAITGFAAIKFLLSFFRKHPINAFAYYRFGLAVVIVAGIWLRT
jgi:undecaprenyl-diphosphatase